MDSTNPSKEDIISFYHQNPSATKTQIAKILGCSRSRVRRALEGMNLDDDNEGVAKKLKKENSKLKVYISNLLEQLESARKTRGLYIPERSNNRINDKTFVRLVIGDLHGSHADTDAISALLRDLSSVKVSEIVMLGDMLECGGFLSKNHSLGYVTQIDESSYEDDIACTNDFLDRISRVTKNPKIYYLEGNHEHRVEKWCVEESLCHSKNAEFLLRAIGPENVLHLKERGIEYYKIGEFHSGLNERGIIKLGKSYFTHGFTTAKHAASVTVERFAGCVFYGHTHRADYNPTRMVHVGLVAAWSPGCLSKLQPRWKHSDPTMWNHGYILQVVNESTGTFHAIPVPIDHGKSYFHTLLECVNR